MKHLLEFQTVDEFTASKDSLDKPNISLVNENGNVYSLMGGGAIDRKITSVKYGTVCLPWNAWVPDGVIVKTVASYTQDGNKVSASLQDYTNPQGTSGKTGIPANTGFVIYSETPGTYTFTYSWMNAEAPESNLLSGNPKQTSASPGENAGYIFVLANKSQGLGFYHLASGQMIAPNCAYLVLKP